MKRFWVYVLAPIAAIVGMNARTRYARQIMSLTSKEKTVQWLD